MNSGALFIVSAIYLQNKTDSVLSAYSARREELSTRQQQIQDMIIALNSTLQLEMEKQQVVATQLGIKLNETASAPEPVINQTPISTPPPKIVITNPAPRVTQAS